MIASPLWLVRYAAREVRGAARMLVFFVACLAVGVAAVVAVDALSSGVESGVAAHARDLLGADAVLQAWRPLPELDEALHGTGARVTHVKEMVTMLAAGETGRSQIVELKVVDPAYPFYGPPRLDPDRPLGALLDAHTVVVADDLLQRLKLRVGDGLRLGGVEFRIGGRILAEADALSGALRLGPRVFLSHEGLARTPLETFGSRILRRALLKLPEGSDAGEARRLVARLRERFKQRDDLRIETYRDVQPAVQRTMRRMEPYLALVAMVSLLLGGIGVGQGVRVWIRGRLDSIAILKALGVRPREVMALYAGQTVLLAGVGSLLGIAAGLAVPAVLPHVLGDVLPPGLLGTGRLGPALHGAAVGIGMAAFFSLGGLLAVWRVPPARVFRQDAEPIPWPRTARAAGAIALLLVVGAVAAVESGSLTRGSVFAAGLLVVVAVLAGGARALAHVAGGLGRRAGPVAVRYGAAALARPGADTLGAVTALGVGLAVVVALATVERHLSRDLAGDLPREAPTAFFIDIQPDQWPAVQSLLHEAGAMRLDSVPVVTARLRSIDGRAAIDIARERAPDRRWSLTREQRLTYLAALPNGNTLLEGSLWSDPSRDEISLEHEFARSLGVTLGTALTFDVQGVPLTLAVTSLRRVDWRTFGINFFAVVEPGVLEDAPQMRLASARLPAEREGGVQDALAASHPNVTVILVREVLERVSAVVSRLAAGVRFLGGFTFAAGLGILGAAFHLAASRRRREVALLKTLGFTRAQVLVAFVVEGALVGAVAGVIGAAAGTALAWAVVARVLELEWTLALSPPLLVVGATSAVTVLTSLLAAAGALRARPAASLR